METLAIVVAIVGAALIGARIQRAYTQSKVEKMMRESNRDRYLDNVSGTYDARGRRMRGWE